MTGGSLSLQQLRDRGFSDEKIAELGGIIHGRNVVFTSRIAGFSSTGEILKLPAKQHAPPAGSVEVMKKVGPALWRELHQWAAAQEVVFAPDAWMWLKKFDMRIPCGLCKNHWRQLVNKNPPAFDSADALFAWTVARHNDVNQMLDTPADPHSQFTLEQARAIYFPGRT